MMKTTICAMAAVSVSLTSAVACDAPGTPNPVTATAISSSKVELHITNTAREGTDHDIWFLIQDRSGNVIRFTQGHIPYGGVAIYDIVNLAPNQTYCYEVWTRDDNPQGCRSQVPSAWACATPGSGTAQTQPVSGNQPCHALVCPEKK